MELEQIQEDLKTALLLAKVATQDHIIDFATIGMVEVKEQKAYITLPGHCKKRITQKNITNYAQLFTSKLMTGYTRQDIRMSLLIGA